MPAAPDENAAQTPSEHPRPAPRRVRARRFAEAKRAGERLVGLTCYDHSTARVLDAAGVDFLLVGDSAGGAVLGLDSTLPVTLDELIPLARGVVRGASRALVVVDLPFGSYETSPEDALRTAVRVMKETGAQAVKLEGGARSAGAIARIVEAGVPVMGHVGFTPQSEHGLGGYVVQGRGAGAERLLADARAVEDAGAFAVVLELVPDSAAERVTTELSIPTIGVGAGAHVDAQLNVWTDWAGLTSGRVPRFVTRYADLAGVLTDAVHAWRADIETGAYPAEENLYPE